LEAVLQASNRLGGKHSHDYATKAAETGRIIQVENGVFNACDEIEKQLK